MPSTDDTAWAIGWVTKPCMRSAEAPGYSVVTVMVELSSSGYWRIGSLPRENRPSSRISVLTTSASTGRRTNRSVKVIAGFLQRPATGTGARHCSGCLP